MNYSIIGVITVFLIIFVIIIMSKTNKQSAKDKWYNKPEMIIAISALVVSLVTTAVSIYSAYIDRAYARASVWPSIEIYRSFGPESFSYTVTNSGNGPAIIKYAQVLYKGEPIKRWLEMPNMEGNITQSHISTRIIPSQQSILPVNYTGPNSNQLKLQDKEVDITLCYCSIYDECWTVDRARKITDVEACVIDNELKFNQ